MPLGRTGALDILSRGVPLNFINPRTKRAARSAENFSVLGLAGKVPGLGVLGLKYHVLGLQLVVSDQSNCS